MQLIWDGELDSGARAAALAAIRKYPPPPGVAVSRCFLEVSTRSLWALATWAVSGVMVWFGLTSENWYLLALAPFMVGAAIMQSFGKISILVRDRQVILFEGVGGIGRRRMLPAVHRVEYAVKRGRGGATAWIVIDGAKFGRHLTERQIEFVIAFLLGIPQAETPAPPST